jgi:TatD DNase family protein
VLVDCHTHLDRYPERVVRAMLARAAGAGVSCVVAAGFDVRSSRRAVRLAERHGTVAAAVGLHPLAVRGPVLARSYAALARLAASPRVVAWSELGLDYRSGTATQSEQRAAFERQLALARECGLAAIVHAVDADDDALALLRDTEMAARSAIHYFVGGPDLAERYLAAGLFLSVGKPVTRVEEAGLRAEVRDAPLDRLLVETDTYPLPGRTTEPADVRLVAEALAALRGLTLEQVAAATSANFARLVGGRGGGPGSLGA